MRKFCSFILLITIFATTLGLVGCDQLVSIVQQDDEHVKAVKKGTSEAYPNKTFGECFENFFSSPAWKYFVGTQNGPDDDGDGNPDYIKNNVDVVEFTGYCLYQEVEVKACIQFILDADGTFEAAYLSFNDVPQNKLILSLLIAKAFEEYDADNAKSNQTNNHGTPVVIEPNATEPNETESNVIKSNVTVPNIVGSDVNFAKQILTDESLIPSVKSEYSEYVEEGRVIRTEPSDGTVVAADSYVTIVKSAGSQYSDNWSYYYGDGGYGSDYGDPPTYDLYTYEDDAYIFPESSIRRLTEEDLMYVQEDVLRIARNEIYARHGRKFNSKDLQEWFNSKSWYHGIYDADEFDESVLNEYEKYNVNFIKSFE